MSDGRIEIDTGIDTGNIESELQRLKRELEGIQNAFQSLNGSLGPLNQNLTTIQNSFSDLSQTLSQIDRDVAINVHANTTAAQAQIHALQQELNTMDHTNVNQTVNVTTNTSGMNNTAQNAQNASHSLNQVSHSAGNATSQLKALQREIREMENAFRLADMQAMAPFRMRMMEVRRDFHVLAGEMGKYKGTNQSFMNSVQALGHANKKATEAMINHNSMLRTSFLMTVGTMLNMSSQASKISANYDRMGNPLLRINRLGLAAADGLNQLAFRGNAAVLALSMLGPNASMYELQQMTMMITQGLMRFQMVALAAAATSVVLYKSLHKAAMESNKGYADSFNTMVASLKKAFEPMVQVFAAVMGKVWDFVNAIAQMAIRFNEAHPILAKIIQGIMMLVPLLTLLLSPLAIGIGLSAGFLAAWSSIWMLIGPLITGIAAMSATIWVLAAAIVAGTALFMHFWKTNEGFRNAVIGAWDAVKQKAIEVFGWLAKNAIPPILAAWESLKQKAIEVFGWLVTFLAPIIEQIKGQFKGLMDAIKLAFTGDFSGIFEIFKQIFPTILAILVGGIPGLIITASRFLPAIAQGMTQGAGTISTVITSVINMITTFLTNELPRFLSIGLGVISQIISGLTTAIPQLVNAMVIIINMIVPIILDMLPVILDAGIKILQALINGIMKVLPALIDAFILIITQVVGLIVSQLPFIIAAGMKILMALINGILKILPQLINTAVKLITTIVQFLIQNLPKIIEMGVKILTSLINGIVKVLPQLITAAVNLIMQIVNTIIANLPQIIQSGIKILTALISGIVKIIPLLIQAAVSLIVAVVKGIVTNLPQIISAGVQILTALIKGILSLVGQLASSVKSGIIDPLISWFKGTDLYQVGADIIGGLVRGISSMAGAVWDKVNSIADGIKNKIKDALSIHSPSRWMRDEVGKMIPEGIAVGIEGNTSLIDKAMKTAANVAMNVVPNMAIPSTAFAGSSNISNSNQSNTFNITIPLDDLEQLNTLNRFVNGMQQRARAKGRG